MFSVSIPGRSPLALAHLILDYNGTIALDGHFLQGLLPRLAAIGQSMEVHVLTADTYGTVRQALAPHGLTVGIVQGADDKRHYLQRLGAGQTAAVGNGTNDWRMLAEAALGIAVLGPEGLAAKALSAADIVVPAIADALDLFLKPQRLVATLRE